MFQLKKQFKINYPFLIILTGLLFIFNNQIMAMNNGNHNVNFETQARILQEMNVEQHRLVQQIFNARNNNVSAEVINDLVRQNMQLSQRIATQQNVVHNAMSPANNPNQSNRNNNRRP
ncbi:MAG: SVM family protein ['Conium maculatum' witches'-broom phytoplasma]|nr:SVM family protein ['Conium maculatum' witches'-broom phytoplasma]